MVTMSDKPSAVLREEAAAWFAAMRGPAAQDRKIEFEAWLAASSANRAAYARIGEIYSLGKGMEFDLGPVPPDRRYRARRLTATVAVLCLLVGSIAWFIAKPVDPGQDSQEPLPMAQAGDHANMVQTEIGEIRRIALADGSTLTLDTNSRVTIAFTPTSRILHLQQGKARFDVAHESRPFQVMAGTMTVTAHGTIFDVSALPNDRYHVHLLRGSIEVSEANRTGAIRPVAKMLSPGEAAEPGPAGLHLVGHAATEPACDDWPAALRTFDRIAVGDLITEANRYSRTKIRIADADVAALNASGTFRIDDTRRLASNLAVLLDLRVRDEADGSISIVSQ